MVVILNNIHLVLILVTALYTWAVLKREQPKSTKIKKLTLAYVLLLVGLYTWNSASKSYGPKGVVTRSPVPEFEVRDVEVKDRLSKPVPLETRDIDRDAKYQKPLPLGEKDAQ